MLSPKILPIMLTCVLLVFCSFLEPELETRSLLGNRIELKIPKHFVVMSDEMLQAKYPAVNRPTLVYTNESGGINVALNLTVSKADQDMIPQYKDFFVSTFKSTYPTAVWKNEGVVEINGRKTGFLELITPALDTEIYNLIFFTDLDGKLLLCSFNCTIEQLDTWAPLAKEIMNSLKISE